MGNSALRRLRGQPRHPSPPAPIDTSVTYAVSGVCADGSRYEGQCTIGRGIGNRYRFERDESADGPARCFGSSGAGALIGDRIIVLWRGGLSVAYRLHADGVLRGAWAGGAATDELAPVDPARPLARREREGFKRPVVLNVEGNYEEKVGAGARFPCHVICRICEEGGGDNNYRFDWRISAGRAPAGEGVVECHGSGTVACSEMKTSWSTSRGAACRESRDGRLRTTADQMVVVRLVGTSAPRQRRASTGSPTPRRASGSRGGENGRHGDRKGRGEGIVVAGHDHVPLDDKGCERGRGEGRAAGGREEKARGRGGAECGPPGGGAECGPPGGAAGALHGSLERRYVALAGHRRVRSYGAATGGME
ncbi:unnamed protein product, partial [Ostreobium quekettii]